MRCPECGARNPDSAAWCTQCYHRFDQPPPAQEDPPPATAPVNRTGMAGAPRDVRERDGVVEWRCGTCEQWAPLELGACPVCGSPRTGFGPDNQPKPIVPDAPVVAVSALLPGLGHLLGGRIGSGVARLGLTLLWLGGGIAIVVGGDTGASRLPGLVLLLGVVTLWAGTVVDAREIQRGGTRELLNARALLWLVVGVTLALILALFVATMAAVGGGAGVGAG